MTSVNQWISELVCNKTFADIGFLWGIQNEKLSVASQCGARMVTGIDQWDPRDFLWEEFDEWMISNKKMIKNTHYHTISSNFLDHDKTYDVIHCSGVIYHCPDPITFLKKLRVSAREHVILTSMITNTHISNESGDMTIPDSSAIFTPALDGRDQEVVATEWRRILAGRPDSGLTQPSNFEISNYHNWWWLFTVPYLNAMCKVCGFEICGTELHQEHFYVILLKCQ